MYRCSVRGPRTLLAYTTAGLSNAVVGRRRMYTFGFRAAHATPGPEDLRYSSPGLSGLVITHAGEE